MIGSVCGTINIYTQDIAENNTAISWQLVKFNNWVYPAEKMSQSPVKTTSPQDDCGHTQDRAPMRSNPRGFTFLEEGREQTSVK